MTTGNSWHWNDVRRCVLRLVCRLLGAPSAAEQKPAQTGAQYAAARQVQLIGFSGFKLRFMHVPIIFHG